ncbi:hypothetical protein [Pedobacter sp. SYP-B3415]|uniref:hypothetical protein n=1 Tax=Pedobacter sp. SYP-B3415 TaxID=2496641 RepID=UPI00101BAED5|nr:hypothetical protein [Pedobacter sp. SYP-B3415]
MCKIIIGIDPGVNTGVAIYNKSTKQLEEVRTCLLHEAFELVISYRSLITMVRVEDARQRKWFGARAEAKQQGAGSVKRDCGAWEDFLVAKEIPHEFIAPVKGTTKVTAAYFAKLTGWIKKTSNHARDAAMLVWGF